MKKFVALLLAMLMVFGLVACGSDEGTTTDTSSSNTTNETADKGDAEQAETSGETSAPSGDFTPADEIEYPQGKNIYSKPADIASEKPLKIATVMVQTNPFGAAVLKGQEFAKSVLADRNCTVDCISVDSMDIIKWTNTLENLIASQYDAICFFGVSDELMPVTQNAIDAGIDVYTFNGDLPDSGRLAWYGMDDYAAGQAAGQALLDAVGEEGSYAIITGDFTVYGHEKRRTGARDVLDPIEGLELVGEYEAHDDAAESYTHATNIITANPDIDAIYLTAGGPSGAAQAVADAGLSGEIAIICHDVLPEQAPYIADGTITACIDQDPFSQGYQPVIDAFNKLVTGEGPKEELNYYDAVIATPDNVKELFPELF